MAQTKRKRRRKHRGTQGGRVDERPRRRPANRAEARQQAKARRSGGGSKRKAASASGGRPLTPPSWRSAAFKAAVAAGIFSLLLVVAFSRPVGASLALAGFMLLFYTPMAYYTDRFMYSRRLSQIAKERAERKQGSTAD